MYASAPVKANLYILSNHHLTLDEKMGLKTYILRRTIYMVILLFFAMTLNFIIFMAMPADPVSILASTYRLKPEQVEVLIEQFGLRESMWVRYKRYMVNMLTWNFGYSFYTRNSVKDEILERLPNTLLLLGVSTIFAILIGIIFGVRAASRRGEISDLMATISSLFAYALPTFWIGMVFLMVFGYWLREWTGGKIYFPLAGTMSRPAPTEPLAKILDLLWHMVLPGITLFLVTLGGYVLLVRSTVLETLTEDYIVTARAKGLSEKVVLFKHALRNAMLPLVTNATLSFAFILQGAILTETVFSWRGIGTYIYQGITFRDYPVLMATFYISCLAVIIANFVADLLYGVIDPRVKYE